MGLFSEDIAKAKMLFDNLPTDQESPERYEAFVAVVKESRTSPEAQNVLKAFYGLCAAGEIEIKTWHDGVMVLEALRKADRTLVRELTASIDSAIARIPWGDALRPHWMHVSSASLPKKQPPAEKVTRAARALGGLALAVETAELSQDMIFRLFKVSSFYLAVILLVAKAAS